MAIYQFLTYVLPKKAVEKRYGNIPKQLEINHAEWEKYWDNWDMESSEPPEPEFQDAISTKWWKEIPIDIEKLRGEIDNILPRASWNNESWKLDDGTVDHDLSIDYNEKEHCIEDFRFRTDLSDSRGIFLKTILDLCRTYDWILMDDRGNLCDPNVHDFVKLIKGSNADRFLQDPMGFLDRLE